MSNAPRLYKFPLRSGNVTVEIPGSFVPGEPERLREFFNLILAEAESVEPQWMIDPDRYDIRLRTPNSHCEQDAFNKRQRVPSSSVLDVDFPVSPMDINDSDFINAYAARDARLQILGFATYDDYLKSDTWRKIRTKVRKRDQYICKCCDHRGEATHHRSYDMQTLRGETIQHLVTLCDTCHKAIEYDGETKSSWEDVERKLLERLATKERFQDNPRGV